METHEITLLGNSIFAILFFSFFLTISHVIYTVLLFTVQTNIAVVKMNHITFPLVKQYVF